MLRSVGKIRDGEEVFIIFDNGIAPVHIDLITELSEEEGTVRMSFAAITQDGDGVPKADVVVRVRMTDHLAYDLCRRLKTLEE